MFTMAACTLNIGTAPLKTKQTNPTCYKLHPLAILVVTLLCPSDPTALWTTIDATAVAMDIKGNRTSTTTAVTSIGVHKAVRSFGPVSL